MVKFVVIQVIIINFAANGALLWITQHIKKAIQMKLSTNKKKKIIKEVSNMTFYQYQTELIELFHGS